MVAVRAPVKWMRQRAACTAVFRCSPGCSHALAASASWLQNAVDQTHDADPVFFSLVSADCIVAMSVLLHEFFWPEVSQLNSYTCSHDGVYPQLPGYSYTAGVHAGVGSWAWSPFQKHHIHSLAPHHSRHEQAAKSTTTPLAVLRVAGPHPFTTTAPAANAHHPV